MTATIFDIQRVSFVDGPGIRTTVFFKGCNLKCSWCHNPESQSPKKRILVYESKCKECQKCLEESPNFFEKCNFCGRCALFCPIDATEIYGKDYTSQEIFR
jgi:pyruvate formate lyase activating enzyme